MKPQEKLEKTKEAIKGTANTVLGNKRETKQRKSDNANIKLLSEKQKQIRLQVQVKQDEQSKSKTEAQKAKAAKEVAELKNERNKILHQIREEIEIENEKELERKLKDIENAPDAAKGRKTGNISR